MQCEACGDAISLSTAYRDDDGNFICQDCHADGQQPQRRTQAQQQQQQQHQPQAQQRQQRETHEQATPSQQYSPDRQQRSPSGSAQRQSDNKADSNGQTGTRSSTKRLQTPRAQTGLSPSGSGGSMANRRPAQQDFNTLRRIGKIISVIGWIIVCFGALAPFAGLMVGGAMGIGDEAAGMGFLMGLGWGIGLALYGLIIVAGGQGISCFVAVERNTRATYELIRKQQA